MQCLSAVIWLWLLSCKAQEQVVWSCLTLGSRSEGWSPLSDCIRGSTVKSKNLSSALSQRQSAAQEKISRPQGGFSFQIRPKVLIPDKLSGTQRGWNAFDGNERSGLRFDKIRNDVRGTMGGMRKLIRLIALEPLRSRIQLQQLAT